MLSDSSSCGNTYGGMVGIQLFTQTLGGMVIILVRELVYATMFFWGMVLFSGGMASLALYLNSSTADNHRHEN